MVLLLGLGVGAGVRLLLGLGVARRVLQVLRLGLDRVVTVKIMPGLLNLLLVAMRPVLLGLRTDVLGELVQVRMTSVEMLLLRGLSRSPRCCSRERVVPPGRVRNHSAHEER